MTTLTLECDVHFDRRGPGSRRVLETGTKPTPASKAGRLPRVTRWMALAIRCEELVRTGVFENYAAIAELGDVSRARVTQIMNLVNLAPDIQEELLELPRFDAGHEPILLAQLQGIAKVMDWEKQRKMWRELM